MSKFFYSSLFLLFLPSLFWSINNDFMPGEEVIIVNKASNKLALIKDNEIEYIFPVATGEKPEATPEGLFTITVKAKDPYYRKKDILGGDPENPLGSRWIGFDAKETDGRTYGIHGTNRPQEIGKYVTGGCVRLSNELVELLYKEVSLGKQVLIVNTSKSFSQLANELGAIVDMNKK